MLQNISNFIALSNLIRASPQYLAVWYLWNRNVSAEGFDRSGLLG